jgi:ribonuclease HI
VVFADSQGKELARVAQAIGRATNNVAEYRALLAALTYAHEQGWRSLQIRTDSELLARQLQGSYRVKNANLKTLHQQAQHLIAEFDSFSIKAVPRKLTRTADKLANAALDGRPTESVTRPSSFARDGERESNHGSRPIRQAQGRPVTRGGPARKSESNPVAPAAGEQRVRAIYEAGVLKPLEKLDVTEGEEVEITIHRKRV